MKRKCVMVRQKNGSVKVYGKATIAFAWFELFKLNNFFYGTIRYDCVKDKYYFDLRGWPSISSLNEGVIEAINKHIKKLRKENKK